MKAEETAEFCRIVRLYFKAWPSYDFDVDDSRFLDLWWRKLREFDLCDVEQALDSLTDRLVSMPSVALVRGEADVHRKVREREYDSAREPQSKARELAKVAHEDNEEAEHLLQRHERFAFSVTIFQVAIALSAIAALARKKIVWLVSLAAGAMGLAFFIIGWLPAVKGEARAEHGSGHVPAHSGEEAPAASAHP